jgi:Ca2+/Na+ antiporter
VIFDRSSQIYTAALLALTTMFVVIATFVKPLGRAGGGILVATFTAYISSIAWAIYKGVVKPPEDSDSDSDSDSNSSDNDGAEEEEGEEEEVKDVERSTPRSSSSTTLRDLSAPADHRPSESIPLAREMFDAADLKPTPDSALQTETHHRRRPRSTTYHVVHLILGFLALSLSGYVLSHSISTLAETFSLAGSVLGITLLSLATTLPEKLVAVFSGARQQPGIMVANTAGSNIFLVTLCAGVLFLAADLDALDGSLTPFELLSMWAASLLLFVIVMVGGRSWMGWASFALYLAFIICEFTANRR